ncbi:MAG: BrnA antitoxin family protein [Xanthomonadales bacterium]|nr:BrnA antitoxin family protein [Xanthomonadales bacterium]MBK7144153.1 BrnA antitoxin family protein [Xanthomonadales bacterium]MCC6561079.1 BrnA antitoxin family protein [Xanthomonadales bacterium]
MRDEYDFSSGKRGPVLSEPGKERITIRIDADILAWFREQVKGGGNYQTLINDTLRAAVLAEDAPLTVRKLREVLRQELHAA